MPTYAELEQESWWGAEFEAPAHAAMNNALRTAWGHSRSETGSKGDNRHLKGRHRSRLWDRNSRYCTNRSYATTDLRDQAGNGNWLRATDCGLKGAPLWAMCRRLDTAVRAGRLPCVAEWFGTFDGATVVGWFEGRASSSDSSHLTHGHVGIWTSFCDAGGQMALLTAILTGGDPLMALSDTDARAMAGRVEALIKDLDDVIWGPSKGEPNKLHTALTGLLAGQAQLAGRLLAVEDKLDRLLAQGGAGGATLAQVEELLNRAVTVGTVSMTSAIAVRPPAPGSGS